MARRRKENGKNKCVQCKRRMGRWQISQFSLEAFKDKKEYYISDVCAQSGSDEV